MELPIMDSSTKTEAVKLCRSCKTVSPLRNFRRRSRNSDSRVHQCNACHAKRERLRRQRKQMDKTRESIVDGSRAIAQATSTYQREAALAAVIERVNGPDEFGKLLADGYMHFRKTGQDRRAFWLIRCMFMLAMDSAVPHRDLLASTIRDRV